MKINQILLKQLDQIKPGREIADKISRTANDFVKGLNKKLKGKKINAEVFIGGSLAKGTLVKKGIYDIDVFVRFNNKYNEKEISGILGKVLGSGKNIKKVHGSIDYYQVKINELIMEIIPVIKIKKPEEAQNVMDLSYFHVNYVLKKLNLFKKDLGAKHKYRKKLADEIILAKSFCHAHNCYGAESYIRGFSGYALELLIIHYGSFEKFLKMVVKASDNKEKIVIDDSKFYKKDRVLRELNESKLNSPIILIDPTYKQRNALAGLSKETLDKFKNVVKKFLKNPNNSFFELKDIKADLLKKHGKNLRIIAVKTNKQAGDIAGTKSKKFLEFLIHVLRKEFSINLAEFDYDEKKNIAEFYFVLSKKKAELIRGPFISDKKNVGRFKKIHKKTIIKNKSVYVKLKHNLSLEKWYKIFKDKEKSIIKQMSIKGIELIR